MKRPNIVFILTDDQGYGDLGCHGNEIIKTPHIDRFYEDCIRMTDYHVGPTCAPTRAGLMTGHYANSTGVWHTIGGRSLLRANEWSLANALQESGYKTGLFGKWHLGDSYPYRPQDRGFDKVVTHGGGGISQTPDFWGNDYFDDTYKENGKNKEFKGYCTDVFFHEAIEFIKKNKNQPFLCFIPTNAPHSPFNVEEKYRTLYSEKVPSPRDRFYGMITNLDENFGTLRSTLQELGLEENTILIFMTDNGTAAGCQLDHEGQLVGGFNAGMRGKKCSPYEGGHRVPFFIRWPEGNLSGGKDFNSLCANVDFMPTLLDLCSISVSDEHRFHGKSLAPYLNGTLVDPEDRAIVTDSQRVTRPEKWKDSAVMLKHWRLINGRELYDLKKDPAQKKDLHAENKEIVAKLREEYELWWDLVSSNFEEEIPLYIDPKKTTTLNTHDWRNEDCSCAWNQAMIREGLKCNGYYEIFVEKAGIYQVSLRRWPNETRHGISKSIDPDQDIEWNHESIDEGDSNHYSGSKALNISSAKLEIDPMKWEKKVDGEKDQVNFEVHLNRGLGRLKSSFSGPEIELGAYYVVIHPIGNLNT